ncbi:hypothetical protein HDU79_007168 [Rhizoclosmatium sp. JEL0117]|nr:hypothetical protein HDU79_007168 [Rhizoclosmatium sp. JEL0117]
MLSAAAAVGPVSPPSTPLRISAPSVHFDTVSDGECGDESPVLEHPHLAATAAPATSSSTTTTTPTTTTTTAATTPNTPAPTSGLPQSLVESPFLASQFGSCLRVRIAALRMLLLDVDGAPTVPLDHLRARLQLGKGRRIDRDFAAESAAAILMRIEDQNSADEPDLDYVDSDMDDNEEVDMMADPSPSSSSHSQTVSQLPCCHYEHASELGSSNSMHLLPYQPPACTCSLCDSLATTQPFYSILNPQSESDLGVPLDPMAFLESLNKNDYHNPSCRRLSVWEDRFAAFADAQGLHPVCIECRKESTLLSRGKGGRRSSGRLTVSQMNNVNEHGHERDNNGSDSDESESDDSDDEEAEGEEEDEDDDDDDDKEEAFLDDYMVKLHELFGLLEVNAKLEEIVFIGR